MKRKNKATLNAIKALSDPTSFQKDEQKTVQKPTEINSLPEESSKKEIAPPSLNTIVSNPVMDVKAVTVISKDTEIVGGISTKGDLEIVGHVNGNIAISGKVTIWGSVKGDIEADELVIKAGRILSQTIKIKKVIMIDEGSDIAGNIECESLITNAKITGNVLARKKCELQIASNIQGDIDAKELSVQLGAILAGKINITRDSDARAHKEITKNIKA